VLIYLNLGQFFKLRLDHSGIFGRKKCDQEKKIALAETFLPGLATLLIE
jgi:hypothetical protein